MENKKSLQTIKEEFVTFEREYQTRDNYWIRCDPSGKIIDNQAEPADTDLFWWHQFEIPLRTWYCCHIAQCEQNFTTEAELDQHIYTIHADLVG